MIFSSISEYEYFVYSLQDKYPTLKNFPHHKHILPDIKHHRIPATEISFDKPIKQ